MLLQFYSLLFLVSFIKLISFPKILWYYCRNSYTGYSTFLSTSWKEMLVCSQQHMHNWGMFNCNHCNFTNRTVWRPDQALDLVLSPFWANKTLCKQIRGQETLSPMNYIHVNERVNLQNAQPQTGKILHIFALFCFAQVWLLPIELTLLL